MSVKAGLSISGQLTSLTVDPFHGYASAVVLIMWYNILYIHTYCVTHVHVLYMYTCTCDVLSSSSFSLSLSLSFSPPLQDFSTG